MKLHSRYSSLVQSAERESFHAIVDMAWRMEASAIVQGTVKQYVAKSSDSKIPGTSDVDLSPLSEAVTKSKKGGRGLRRSKKSKFWDQIKSGLGLGDGSSSGSGNSRCTRCGRQHKGVCLIGTTACFRCGQEGHMARECPTIIVSAQCPQTSSDHIIPPEAPTRDREREVVPSSGGSFSGRPLVPARIFTQDQPETDTPNTVVPGKLTFECSDVYRLSVDMKIVKCNRVRWSETSESLKVSAPGKNSRAIAVDYSNPSRERVISHL